MHMLMLFSKQLENPVFKPVWVLRRFSLSWLQQDSLKRGFAHVLVELPLFHISYFYWPYIHSLIYCLLNPYKTCCQML